MKPRRGIRAPAELTPLGNLACTLAQWRVAHAEAGANVLRKQCDGVPVGNRIGLRQIPHRFNQNSLAINIARIRPSLARRLSAHIGWDGNSKYLSHVAPELG